MDEKVAGQETPNPDAEAAKVTADAAKAAADQAAADTAAAEKTAADKTAADAVAAAAEKAKGTPPEKYSLSVPTGAEAWLGESDLAQFEIVAKKEGLTNEQAQLVIEREADRLVAQSTVFRAQTEADAEYGGEKLAQTQKLGGALLDRVRPAGTPRGDAVRALLAKTGYGNHIEIVALLADLGKMMAEDSPIQQARGVNTPVTKEDMAKLMFDHPSSKVG